MSRAFGVYVHVPFCATRCGYCAFNTYAVGELVDASVVERFADAVIAEIGHARRGAGARSLDTVFFGGGTPTLLPAATLVRLLAAVCDAFPPAGDLEVTVEANPDSVTEPMLRTLREGGFNRISFGMQSAQPHVLAMLDRTHRPGNVEAAVGAARSAGFEHINLDLIYGTPSESDKDWIATISAALALPVDHISAYALAIEPSTKLSLRVKQGRMPQPDDDSMAARYELLDDTLAVDGFEWYELSNWAKSPSAQCRHNLGYWRNHDWWGLGPGAHGHLDGERFVNVKSPDDYVARLGRGKSPIATTERPSAAERALEHLMLGIRLAEGLAAAELDLGALVDDGLIAVVGDRASTPPARAVLTRRGRQLADWVVRDLYQRLPPAPMQKNPVTTTFA